MKVLAQLESVHYTSRRVVVRSLSVVVKNSGCSAIAQLNAADNTPLYMKTKDAVRSGISLSTVIFAWRT